jgi:hypothetical protein
MLNIMSISNHPESDQGQTTLVVQTILKLISKLVDLDIRSVKKYCLW